MAKKSDAADAAAVEKKSETVAVTYQPTSEGPDDTVVDGISFHAYEPVDIDAARATLIEKLHANPWFTADKTDADREREWKAARDAQAKAKKAMEDAKAAGL